MTIPAHQLDAAIGELKTALAAGHVAPAVQRIVAFLDDGGADAQQWMLGAHEVSRFVQPLAAAHVLERGLVRWPASTDMRYLLGNALRAGGRTREAEQALRAVIAAEPAHADAPVSLAFLLREQGRLSAAAQTIVTLWKRQPRTRDGDYRAVKFLQECHRHADAEELAEPILAAHPRDAELLALLGENALLLGRFGSAQRRLRAAVEIDPQQAAAWLRLAHTHRFAAGDDDDLALLRAAQARGDLADEARVCVEFALGKAYDDLAEREEAVRAWRAANARRRAARPWDAYGWARFVDAQRSAPPLPAVAADPSTTPVFIVGMPRSGTTLVASLLGRNRDVKNRNELNWIAALAANLGATPAPAALASAGALYRAHLVQDDEPARCHVDKNPLNFRHLRLVAAMLPNAKIIHCRRDPLDTALSLWSQHFAHDDMRWAYDFGDIAAYWRGYQALMGHWHETLAVPVFDLDYEAMVADSGATLARLAAFLGIGDAQRDAAAGEAIATASVWQARQAVYASSVGRWRAYEALLPELSLAFG
ncbi:tetratricopeptide repeat-containing sulfotransferase family protein [Tahibacter soli]|uniref:Sulfotransferase n=1 Tax=Tahibacter soli TaxID=2983605 RepID=A0A9X3YIS5_9GAMM|nr:sulfotransferase [Tahibacter soli]MDC8011866.1 sulfotransferase [Tahibacter soli]